MLKVIWYSLRNWLFFHTDRRVSSRLVERSFAGVDRTSVKSVQRAVTRVFLAAVGLRIAESEAEAVDSRIYLTPLQKRLIASAAEYGFRATLDPSIWCGLVGSRVPPCPDRTSGPAVAPE
jgi:hypothetical protein